ncbi:MAG: NAD(P)/FAD-dependent oxidoreductase [Spirochaetaceae bacterium]|nr:NAD(P)/FAD-dependent oxidoreductase [Spirochaetia bacterium]MCF7951771.1 NAD(P)/FAD-dependent oxidoreductase [Spirochaetaceae bacterium]
MKQIKPIYSDILIVGAGPAGLMAALQAAQVACSGCSIRIIEKNPRAGRKLLAAGAGRCNISHTGSIEEYLQHYGPLNGSRKKLLKAVLYSFSPADLGEFFAHRDLPLKELNEGKLFPRSERSLDVVELLERSAEQAGIHIHYSDPVAELYLGNSEGETAPRTFRLRTASGTIYEAGKLLLASGGASYPQTGSTGDGYELSKELGHRIVPPRPALAPIELEAYPFGELSGISLPVELRYPGASKKAGRTTGDLLFTHRGLSGPVILNSSRYLAQGTSIEIAFTDKTPEELLHFLSEAKAAGGSGLLKSRLRALELPARFIRLLLQHTGIPEELKLADLGKQASRKLTALLTAWPLRVSRVGGWDKAMLTSGGVALPEVHPHSLESRLVPGLFFAGELLDIDGDEGGYNLQFAFSSGAVAGRSAAEQI